jgi:hypothetical protein
MRSSCCYFSYALKPLANWDSSAVLRRQNLDEWESIPNSDRHFSFCHWCRPDLGATKPPTKGILGILNDRSSTPSYFTALQKTIQKQKNKVYMFKYNFLSSHNNAQLKELIPKI